MHITLGLCLFAVTLQCTQAFLLDSTCTVSAPCVCTGKDIHCESKNLSEIPSGFTSDISERLVWINFERNNMKEIKVNAFKNWYQANASINEIWMLLAFNSIDHIQDGAFSGIYDSLEYIDLRSNNLVTIPRALTEVSGLWGLRLEGNPITHFDGNIFAVLGGRLGYASLGFEYFKTWPQELHLLRSVEHLGLYNIPFPMLDIDAFHGLENSVRNLSIHQSKLWKIPAAVCSLRVLEHLLVEDNRNLDDARSSVFAPCLTAMPTVQSLKLISNNLTYFPDVFMQFPNLTDLRVTGNGVYFIDTQTIPIDISNISKIRYQVRILLLDNNLFTRIPTAIWYLGIKSNPLSVLSLKSNKITTIEFWDIAFLNLTELYLNDNPLIYITPYLTLDGQKNMNFLRVLRLDNTNLAKIPESVTGFSKLENFGISGNTIECTCSMAYLKHWDTTALQVFDGVCEYSTVTLKHYIEHDLQVC